MKTDITVVLDRSGSMATVLQDTVGGFNTFLKDQQGESGECDFTLVQFDDRYQIDYDGVPIKNVNPLIAGETYTPRGMTGLYDAIGKAILAAQSRLKSSDSGCPTCKDKDTANKVLFVIQTDGHENSSQEFDAGKIKQMIEHQRKAHDWGFVFLGADQNAWESGSRMGFSMDSSVSYTNANIGGTMKSLSDNFKKFRSNATYSADNLGKDMKDDK